ncbi:hypothetical protein JX265_004383 [Neoarthrinium moseri]|uniref:Uncharacterized protein n=1 Tax=Neoarthrinium moseri TaxID=1658444 RepID=A0A9Q0AR69_9PEZI|nr:hypothetical protein JX266_003954 [Neoarthrinium moseri]KAI1875325.1 hypothetical protein JX265_004383 [Neoarthrinium moseri]
MYTPRSTRIRLAKEAIIRVYDYKKALKGLEQDPQALRVVAVMYNCAPEQRPYSKDDYVSTLFEKGNLGPIASPFASTFATRAQSSLRMTKAWIVRHEQDALSVASPADKERASGPSKPGVEQQVVVRNSEEPLEMSKGGGAKEAKHGQYTEDINVSKGAQNHTQLNERDYRNQQADVIYWNLAHASEGHRGLLEELSSYVDDTKREILRNIL